MFGVCVCSAVCVCQSVPQSHFAQRHSSDACVQRGALERGSRRTRAWRAQQRSSMYCRVVAVQCASMRCEYARGSRAAMRVGALSRGPACGVRMELLADVVVGVCLISCLPGCLSACMCVRKSVCAAGRACSAARPGQCALLASWAQWHSTLRSCRGRRASCSAALAHLWVVTRAVCKYGAASVCAAPKCACGARAFVVLCVSQSVPLSLRSQRLSM